METPSSLTFTVSDDPKFFNKTHKYRLRPQKIISDFSYCNLLLSQYTLVDLFLFVRYPSHSGRSLGANTNLRVRASPFLDMLFSAEYWLLLPESNTLHSEKIKIKNKKENELV